MTITGRAETERPAPAADRASPRARHGLPSHQRLSCDRSFPQTGMITAAALTLPHLRPSVTRVSGQHQAPRPHGGCDLWLRSQGHHLQLPYQGNALTSEPSRRVPYQQHRVGRGLLV
jgi:hypothetical protein